MRGRRYEDIIETFREALSSAPIERHPILLVELETALATYCASQRSELQPYTACPRCHLIYSETQFSFLPASAFGLSRRDEYELTELRRCRLCAATVERVLEVYKPRPVAGQCVHVIHQQRRPCANCRGWVDPGQALAVLRTKEGDVKLAPLCLLCEEAS